MLLFSSCIYFLLLHFTLFVLGFLVASPMIYPRFTSYLFCLTLRTGKMNPPYKMMIFFKRNGFVVIFILQ